jgi:DNA-binding HxlR family transcriptional regulator
MARTDLGAMRCSIARTLAVLDDWWSPLILRDVFVGITRFDELQRDLGIARNVLSARLAHLVDAGVLDEHPYQDHPVRHDYVLTEKGRDLIPAIVALMAWGDRWTAGRTGPPARLRHTKCGELTEPIVTCAACGEPIRADELSAHAGPGGKQGPGTQVIATRLPR